MIEITEVHGRYEVLSPGRHWEVFEGRLGAQAAALALAAEIERETGTPPGIAARWPVYLPVRSPQATMPACPSLPASTGAPTTT